MRDEMSIWEELERPGPDSVRVPSGELRSGSRVKLLPRAGGDVFDAALAGKAAVVEKIESDMEGNVHLAVTVEDDPGRDLGIARQPGHRFFFSVEEVELLPDAPPSQAAPRVLVAGIGNVFLGDDGFGVEVATRLATRKLPAGVEVADVGIRGMHLAFSLQDYDAAILVDATPRGQPPGTLYVIEPDVGDSAVGLDAHGMDPVTVLRLAAEFGRVPERVLVVGCEPARMVAPEDDEVVMELSEPVRASLDEAVRLIESLVEDLISSDNDREVGEGR